MFSLFSNFRKDEDWTGFPHFILFCKYLKQVITEIPARTYPHARQRSSRTVKFLTLSAFLILLLKKRKLPVFYRELQGWNDMALDNDVTGGLHRNDK